MAPPAASLLASPLRHAESQTSLEVSPRDYHLLLMVPPRFAAVRPGISLIIIFLTQFRYGTCYRGVP